MTERLPCFNPRRRFLSFLTVLFWRMRRVGEVFFMEAEDTGSGAT